MLTRATAAFCLAAKMQIADLKAEVTALKAGGGDDEERKRKGTKTINKVSPAVSDAEKNQGSGASAEVTRKRIAASADAIRELVRASRASIGRGPSLKNLFNTMDVDGSGLIDRGEFLRFVVARAEENPDGRQPTRQEIEDAFDSVDTDQSGEIDFTEFVMYFGPE